MRDQRPFQIDTRPRDRRNIFFRFHNIILYSVGAAALFTRTPSTSSACIVPRVPTLDSDRLAFVFNSCTGICRLSHFLGSLRAANMRPCSVGPEGRSFIDPHGARGAPEHALSSVYCSGLGFWGTLLKNYCTHYIYTV